jgi:hypothetical protein
MTWTSLVEQFRHWTAEIRQSLEMENSEPMATDSPEWYTGLVVSPTSFSRQLGDMQVSLMEANASGSGRAATEEMTVGTRRGCN